MSIKPSISCDHATDAVPVCSACFHTNIYQVCMEAGLAASHADKIADAAMVSALESGHFTDD